MIETVMLVALGFLCAGLIVLIVAPAFWARAVRLTNERIRRSMPLTEAEMRADKDLLRAEYAVRVHQLEKEIEQSKLAAHRQLIEINRRTAEVTRLEKRVGELGDDLDENRNARGVLEQTVNDRLPKLEGRLEEARKLLRARDQEINDLVHDASRQTAALEEARAMNAQLGSEVERLQGFLSDFQSRERRRGSEIGAEAEYALRNELEQLRSQSREQAGLIDRLQRELSGGRALAMGGKAEGEGDISVLRGRLAEQAAELRRLRETMGAAGGMASETTLAATARDHEREAVAAKLTTAEATIRDQAAEIERLKAELDLAQQAAIGDSKLAVKESKAFLKAKLDRMSAEVDREQQIISRLRAELAASNERAARQAAQFMDEMRRFGTRSHAVPRSTAVAAGGRPKSLGERFGQGPVEPAVPAASPIAALRAPEDGAGSSARARELQRTLEARFESGDGGKDAAPASDEAADKRGKLLDRLRSYEET
ncbi:MAG: hypothetical protein R3D33_16510 [Hyphomicrobiaceae bacterium]